MDANLIPTAASPRQDATPQEVATRVEPAGDALVPTRLWPSWAEDIEEREIDQVAPGLEDLGLFA
jgi:hypothetical protein